MVMILITGGAGFMGSNFVHHMAKRYPEYGLVVLDALTYAGSMDNLPAEMQRLSHPTLRFWYGDVRNAELVNSLVAEADYVVHFAAETHVTRSIFDNRLFFETDVIGTHTVANAVLKSSGRVKRFIHISSSEVYGTAETPLMDEGHPLKPMSPYASAKCGADRLVYSYWTTYRLPCTILRPFNNFGPRQHLEKLVPRFVTSVLLGENLTVHGDGQAARDFVYVGDVCRAIDLALHADAHVVDGEVFNVASGQHRSILAIAQDVLGAMSGNGAVIENTSNRPGQVTRHTGDYGKIRRVLGWEPEVGWAEGLRRTIKWYSENADWWEKQVWMRHIPIITASGVREYH
jgi:dTDP-glucose 4,6-dehydratase